RDVRKQFAHPQATFAPLLKGKIVLPQQAHLTEKHIRFFVATQRLTMAFGELRLVIKRIKMAESAAQANVDNAFRLGRMVWWRIFGLTSNWSGRDDSVARQ